MNAAEKLKARSKPETAEKDKNKVIFTCQLDEMNSQLLNDFLEGKRAEQSVKPAMDAGEAGMNEVKRFAQAVVDREFHGTTPPDRVQLRGEIKVPVMDEIMNEPLLDEHGRQVYKTVTITHPLNISKTNYGRWKVDKEQCIEKPEEIRAVVGNQWFDQQFNDISRVVVNLKLVKDEEKREAILNGLVKILDELDVPTGTMDYQERYKPKSSFHTDRFALDVDRHNKLTKLIGGCGMTAGKFTG